LLVKGNEGILHAIWDDVVELIGLLVKGEIVTISLHIIRKFQLVHNHTYIENVVNCSVYLAVFL
jgi:hypothetical protein